jgi:uncharacterized membrane protein YfcA
LNIAVSGIAFYNYSKAKHFSPKFSLPFLSSIPFAFFAGLLNPGENTLAIVFVVALLASSAALFFSGQAIKKRELQVRGLNLTSSKLVVIGAPSGAVLGSIAGLVGIGGGIWLSPLLILSGLADPKRAAATASFFILTNSISGFTAHAITKPIDFELLLPLLVVVIVGGFLGSRFGAFKINHEKLRIIIAGIVVIAAINIAYQNWFT